MASATTAAEAYESPRRDRVREVFERRFFASLVPRLLERAGGDVLDLGCGDALASSLAGPRLRRYLGVDLRSPAGCERAAVVEHDLRDGLGPVGSAPFDVYLGTFGIGSHLSPAELRRLLGDIASHARPGSLVAIEALGLGSLEWPGLWERPPGPNRTICYRLASEVSVHPWAPRELFALYESSGIRPLRAIDRTLQAGPKCGEGDYWPGLPRPRAALDTLLAGADPAVCACELAAPLPPLPAGAPALVHHTLAARRRALLRQAGRAPLALAEAVWALDPPTCGGYGHGLMVVGRVGLR